MFYVTVTGNFPCFQYFNFEASFLKNELMHRFLIERTETEKATFLKKYQNNHNYKNNYIITLEYDIHKIQKSFSTSLT